MVPWGSDAHTWRMWRFQTLHCGVQDLGESPAVRGMRISLEEERLAALDFLHSTIDHVRTSQWPVCMRALCLQGAITLVNLSA